MTLKAGRDGEKPGEPLLAKENEHERFRGCSQRGAAQPPPLCLAVVAPGHPFLGLPDCPPPRAAGPASFLPPTEPRRPLPPGGFSLRSRGMEEFRLFQLRQIPRQENPNLGPVLSSKGPHPGLAFSCLEAPVLMSLPHHHSQSPCALPTWSSVKVPSLHDTDMWGVLLLQAWPLPIGGAIPIAVTISG